MLTGTTQPRLRSTLMTNWASWGAAFNTLSVKIERSNEQSESERRRLDSVLSHMTDGVIATDRHGNVSIMNQMAQDFLDVKAEDAIKKPISQVLGLGEDYTSQGLDLQPKRHAGHGQCRHG